MKATRDGFGDQLVKSGQNNKNIIVLNADLGKATRAAKFIEEYPSRSFEVGIAECNMIGIASGLADQGYLPVISSFASFLTGKYDVIRVSLAYSGSPVILVGTHSGMAIGKDGVTQMGLEDLSLMRSMPNVTVIQPATYLECVGAVKYVTEEMKLDGPVYLRLGRQPVQEVFNEDYKFDFGKPQQLREGTDAVIFSTGCILPEVLKAQNQLEKNGFSASVVNVHTLKPVSSSHILNLVKNKERVITVEDHSIIGGLGSMMAEILCENEPKKLLRIGLMDEFPESGPPAGLYEKYGLDADGITTKILGAIQNGNRV